jgi:Tfp pilus assembly protein PilN
MRAVNLLPRDEPKKSFEAGRGVVFGAAGGAALVTAGLTALLLSASGSLGEHQSRIDALNAELAAIPKSSRATETAAEDAGISSELSKRSTALSTVLSGRVAWDSVLRQVSQVLPDDVWLTNLTSSEPDSSDTDPNAASTTGLVLTGATYAQSGVARLLSRLAVAPTLANVRLQTSTVTESGPSTEFVKFTILADVRTVGDAS